ncbi:hypothetical protein L7F22_030704 [Adiantum nelumboides]|nr:hypothetical protein [Adiantum nelumboides]
MDLPPADDEACTPIEDNTAQSRKHGEDKQEEKIEDLNRITAHINGSKINSLVDSDQHVKHHHSYVHRLRAMSPHGNKRKKTSPPSTAYRLYRHAVSRALRRVHRQPITRSMTTMLTRSGAKYPNNRPSSAKLPSRTRLTKTSAYRHVSSRLHHHGPHTRKQILRALNAVRQRTNSGTSRPFPSSNSAPYLNEDIAIAYLRTSPNYLSLLDLLDSGENQEYSAHEEGMGLQGGQHSCNPTESGSKQCSPISNYSPRRGSPCCSSLSKACSSSSPTSPPLSPRLQDARLPHFLKRSPSPSYTLISSFPSVGSSHSPATSVCPSHSSRSLYSQRWSPNSESFSEKGLPRARCPLSSPNSSESRSEPNNISPSPPNSPRNKASLSSPRQLSSFSSHFSSSPRDIPAWNHRPKGLLPDPFECPSSSSVAPSADFKAASPGNLSLQNRLSLIRSSEPTSFQSRPANPDNLSKPLVDTFKRQRLSLSEPRLPSSPISSSSRWSSKRSRNKQSLSSPRRLPASFSSYSPSPSHFPSSPQNLPARNTQSKGLLPDPFNCPSSSSGNPSDYLKPSSPGTWSLQNSFSLVRSSKSPSFNSRPTSPYHPYNKSTNTYRTPSLRASPPRSPNLSHYHSSSSGRRKLDVQHPPSISSALPNLNVNRPGSPIDSNNASSPFSSPPAASVSASIGSSPPPGYWSKEWKTNSVSSSPRYSPLRPTARVQRADSFYPSLKSSPNYPSRTPALNLYIPRYYSPSRLPHSDISPPEFPKASQIRLPTPAASTSGSSVPSSAASLPPGYWSQKSSRCKNCDYLRDSCSPSSNTIAPQNASATSLPREPSPRQRRHVTFESSTNNQCPRDSATAAAQICHSNQRRSTPHPSYSLQQVASNRLRPVSPSGHRCR